MTQHLGDARESPGETASLSAPGYLASRVGLMTGQPPANWYPDPFRRYEHRYWDGIQWTHHVGAHGRQGIDPPVEALPAPLPSVSPEPVESRASKRIQRQVEGSFGVAQSVDVALLNEPVLVVNQKAKLFGTTAEYAVYNQQGQRIGAVREVGHVLMRRALGAGGERGTHKFEIVDAAGAVLMALHRPAKVIKSKMIVVGRDGTRGEIIQKTVGVLGNVRFSLESGGRTLGAISAESRAAWDFSIQDADRSEVARITKTWAGWAKEHFTKADNYVVHIHRALEEPMRSMVVAAALAVDTALKQDGNWQHRRGR